MFFFVGLCCWFGREIKCPMCPGRDNQLIMHLEDCDFFFKTRVWRFSAFPSLCPSPEHHFSYEVMALRCSA